MDVRADLLAKTPLFAGLSERDLEAVAACCFERRYGRGEVVFHQGDPGDALHVVAEGLLKVFVTGESGDQMVLATLGPGETFGELAVVDGGPRSATVQALEPSRLLSVTRSALLAAMARHPAVAESLLASLGRLVRRMIEQAGDLVFLDLHGRVAKLLVGFAEKQGGPELDLRITQRELAAMVGGSRQSVNAVLHAFERRGFLELAARTIVVKDLPALRRRAGLEVDRGR